MTPTTEQRREALVGLFEQVKDCRRCPLHETRTKAVFGAGNADADLIFVGEAPGAEEDRQGLPFVGRAGQLLNQLLEEIGLSRDDVFIANVLKSRPPGNRDPQPEEIEACKPYLFEQVQLIEPRVVCTLGNFATKLLSGNPTGITRVRGAPQVHELGGRAVFLLPLFHPAAALRTPAVKETLRGDFATIPELLRRPIPGAELEAEAEPSAEVEEAPEAVSPNTPRPPDEEQMGLFG
jgi:uracil-DNA glycosylase family 4